MRVVNLALPPLLTSVTFAHSKDQHIIIADMLEPKMEVMHHQMESLSLNSKEEDLRKIHQQKLVAVQRQIAKESKNGVPSKQLLLYLVR